MGISGAMRRDELTKMTIDDILDENSALIITVPDTKTGKKRIFTVTSIDHIRIYRKYVQLRPKHITSRRVFIRYTNGKCNAQVVGVHKIGQIPSLIAKYLELPNSQAYTGHCYRRSSATLLANTGADMRIIKSHGGWKSSTVAEGYVEDSIENKKQISNAISGVASSSNKDLDVELSYGENLPISNINCSKSLDLVKSGVCISNNTNCTINVSIYPK